MIGRLLFYRLWALEGILEVGKRGKTRNQQNLLNGLWEDWRLGPGIIIGQMGGSTLGVNWRLLFNRVYLGGGPNLA